MNRPMSVLLTVTLLACAGKGGDDTSGTSGDDTGGGGGGGTEDAVCTEPSEISCEDQLVLDLSLQSDVSDGEVTTTVDGDDFVTVIDATAGGYQQAANNPWVYVRFTDSGAEKVEIDDETALTSMDWDLSARRFILRLNGGNSGPSCVGAAALLEAPYEDVASVPDGLRFSEDAYYTPDCTIINDSSGLPGSPQVAMGAWWSYSSCVATTGYTQLIQLASGRVVKARVETYYGSGQDECNRSGTPGEDGGIITVRWRFL